MKYRLTSTHIIRDDGASFPANISNRDYREYLKWLEDGNTPGVADPELDVMAIATDSNIIIGDGVDEITLVVQGRANALITINALVGAESSSVNIQLDENGRGSQVFSCETSPTVIVLSHGNISVKVRAL